MGLPGGFIPLRMGGKAKDYGSLIAAIPNKTVYLRADTSAAADGDTLNLTPWDNEASATNTNGNAVWDTNELNGYRGIRAGSLNINAELQLNVGDIFGNPYNGFTAFFVERRTGTQGSNAGDGRYVNNVAIGGSDYCSILFEGSARRFYAYTYNTGFAYADMGVSFTDNVPYVVGVRVGGDGVVRTNFNGTIYNSYGTSTTGLGHYLSPGYVNKNCSGAEGAGPNYGFEYILSKSQLSDSNIDDIVGALRAKWGV